MVLYIYLQIHNSHHFSSYVLSYVVFMINSEPIKNYSIKSNQSNLQKLANQSMLNGTLVIEMINNSFSASKKNFGRLIKQGTF